MPKENWLLRCYCRFGKIMYIRRAFYFYCGRSCSPLSMTQYCCIFLCFCCCFFTLHFVFFSVLKVGLAFSFIYWARFSHRKTLQVLLELPQQVKCSVSNMTTMVHWDQANLHLRKQDFYFLCRPVNNGTLYPTLKMFSPFIADSILDFDNSQRSEQCIYNYTLPRSPLSIKRPERSLIGWLKFQMKEGVIMID